VGNAWELRLSGTIPETSQLFVGEFGLWRRLRNNAVHFVDAALFAQSQWDQQPFVDALQLAAVLARCKDSFKDGTTTQPRGNTYGIALVQSPLAQPCLNLPRYHACIRETPPRNCAYMCTESTPSSYSVLSFSVFYNIGNLQVTTVGNGRTAFIQRHLAPRSLAACLLALCSCCCSLRARLRGCEAAMLRGGVE